MAKKQQLTPQQEEEKALCQEFEEALLKSVVPALMSRDDVAAVSVPKQLGLGGARGTIIIVFQDGTNARARFTVDQIFTV